MSPNRLIQLDLLRAAAIFLVLGSHLILCPPEINYLLYLLTKFWSNGGWVGVDLFFVLSGFLVSGLIFREYQNYGTVRIKRFLIRRGFKIYPSFYLMIAVTVIFSSFFEKEIPIKTLLAELFFVQNFFGKLWPHTWSLAVEEHFYFGLALLTFVFLHIKSFKKDAFGYIPHLFILIAFVCLVLRALMAVYKGTSIGLTFFRMDALFFGVLISYYWNFGSLKENQFLKSKKNWFIFLGIILFLPPFFFKSIFDPWFFVFGMTTNYLAGGLLLLGVLNREVQVNFFSKTIAYIGTYSYSIYLWHFMIQDWIVRALMKQAGIDNWFFYAGFYLFGTIILGIVFSKIVEFPLLRIRDKYFPSRSVAIG
jgi:peptidoglycan/LPS O-acetylase OafA/YrhL